MQSNQTDLNNITAALDQCVKSGILGTLQSAVNLSTSWAKIQQDLKDYEKLKNEKPQT